MTDADAPVIDELLAGERGAPRFSASATPPLTWRVRGGGQDWTQAAAELEVQRDGRTEVVPLATTDSAGVPWPVAPLLAYETVSLRVRVQGADGIWSPFCAPVAVEAGPLGPDDWSAAFVALPGEPGDDRGTVRFRRVLDLRAQPVRALLSLTAHGVVEAVLNGSPVGDEVLAPGWTAYDQRLLLSTHDVTAQLHAGANVLGATVAEGWYRERFGFDGRFAVAYPGPVALAVQLRIEHADGTVETLVTDETWTASTAGPTVSASIYQGEHHDARHEDAALADPAVALPDAQQVAVLTASAARLRPAPLPPIRRIERVPVREVLPSASGGRILDFGQNLVGWLELDVDLPAGTELVLRHAEVLEHGELGVRPLRFAAATDRYVAADGPRRWSPRFTFHGFRYAEVTGWPGGVDPDRVTAVVVHSDLVRTGHLETSDPLLNRLHENVLWGMRGNFLGIPTDCPQRDERLGWTGDIAVFTPTASYLYDVSAFLGSWLTDLALQQGDDGAVPMVVPSPLPERPTHAAVWGDAAALVPSALHERFGSVGVLAAQYPSVRAWVEGVRALAGEDLLWTGSFQFGDWLDPTAPPHNPAAAKTDADLIATASFFRSTEQLAAAARLLGDEADAAEYDALAAAIKAAFQREYVTDAGRLLSDAHTAYGVAIAFGLVDGERRRLAGDRLAELVRAYGYRVRTGFVGTPLLCDALTATGHADVAYRLLLERGNPSWLYPVTMGATTIWERWDSMLPDGSINPGEMTSFNHYALGAVADWMQRTIGGIAPAEPGYRVVRIAPVPGGGLTHASASLDTPYGPVTTAWRIDGDRFALDVTVPPNASAVVVLPGSDAEQSVGSGSRTFTATLPAVPAAPRLTMDSPVGDFVDDQEVRARLEGFFAEIGYFIGLGWNDSGRWRSDARLSSSLLMFPAEQLPRLEALVAELDGAR